MKHIKASFIAAFMVFGLFVAPLSVFGGNTSVSAASPQAELCKGSGGKWVGGKCDYGDEKKNTDVRTLLGNIVNILLFVIGAVAVIMIIIGGIRYTTSNGDQAQVTSAKNTILYAVVGIVVAVMAYAIVGFVLASL